MQILFRKGNLLKTWLNDSRFPAYQKYMTYFPSALNARGIQGLGLIKAVFHLHFNFIHTGRLTAVGCCQLFYIGRGDAGKKIIMCFWAITLTVAKQSCSATPSPNTN